MVDDERSQVPRNNRGPHYGIELGVLITVTIIYFVMTCGGVAI